MKNANPITAEEIRNAYKNVNYYQPNLKFLALINRYLTWQLLDGTDAGVIIRKGVHRYETYNNMTGAPTGYFREEKVMYINIYHTETGKNVDGIINPDALAWIIKRDNILEMKGRKLLKEITARIRKM